MTKKTPGEHAAIIHKAVADLNCLMATAAQDGIHVDLDQRELQTVAGRFPALTVALFQRVTP